MPIYIGGASNAVVTAGYKMASYQITMSNSDTTFYPILFSRPMGAKIAINKHVHSGGTWDGYLQFQIETNLRKIGKYVTKTGIFPIKIDSKIKISIYTHSK